MCRSSDEPCHDPSQGEGILRYAIAAVVLVALMFIGVASAWTPTRSALNERRWDVQHMRADKCLPKKSLRPMRLVPLSRYLPVWHAKGEAKRRIRERESTCLSDKLMTWYYSSGAKCVHEHEGAWNSNTGNGYYGGFQADLSFASSYGAEYYPPTPDQWTPLAQIHMAYRGWLARGWYPWPNTARMCGLL